MRLFGASGDRLRLTQFFSAARFPLPNRAGDRPRHPGGVRRPGLNGPSR